MNQFSGTSLFLSLQLLLSLLSYARPGSAQLGVVPEATRPQVTALNASDVQHAYGLPDTKPKAKGTLTVNADGITFKSKSGIFTIPQRSVIAVSAGNERVELWGMKGRLLRMAIPNGGGLAAAGVMHHKVGMLTVEFSDSKQAYHAAVFLLPVDQAQHFLASFSQVPLIPHEAANTICQNSSISPRSVLVSTPVWDQAEVPAAYRALVYEHLIDRLQHLEGIGHVYREGENDAPQGCPQYTIHISIAGFKQGSQVERAVMGPVGMFVGTTQMTFDATISDASGKLNVREQVKATVRGESESANVADGVAKNLARHYSTAQKRFEKSKIVISTDTTRI
jgi:hypothetical protein